MAKNRRTPDDSSGSPRLEAQEAIRLLKVQLEKGQELLKGNQLDSTSASAWRNTTRELLVAAFGPESHNIAAVLSAGSHRIFPMGTPSYVIDQQRRKNFTASLKMLESCIEQLELLGARPTTSLGAKPNDASGKGRKIFIVHGHDNEKKEAVARFLGRLDLDPLILHEQASLGLTLIEKFELYAGVRFAVVILTADDLGSPVDQPEAARPRARQNVVFELGYFIGRLTRQSVCTLYEEGIEIPSDYQGIVYIPFDEAGGWRMSLARELKAAGFAIDLNKAL